MREDTQVRALMVDGEIFTILHYTDGTVGGYSYFPDINKFSGLSSRPVDLNTMRYILGFRELKQDEIDYLLVL